MDTFLEMMDNDYYLPGYISMFNFIGVALLYIFSYQELVGNTWYLYNFYFTDDYTCLIKVFSINDARLKPGLRLRNAVKFEEIVVG